MTEEILKNLERLSNFLVKYNYVKREDNEVFTNNIISPREELYNLILKQKYDLTYIKFVSGKIYSINFYCADSINTKFKINITYETKGNFEIEIFDRYNETKFRALIFYDNKEFDKFYDKFNEIIKETINNIGF